MAYSREGPKCPYCGERMRYRREHYPGGVKCKENIELKVKQGKLVRG